ncbi:MAG: hypothetical protein ACRD88_05795, partial [Terriglobia bacterium]
RHARAELRPVRALSTGLLVLVICLLIGLICWTSTEGEADGFFPAFYVALLGLQGGVLSVWCLFACGQAVTREREMKTYDFLRTTRLTAAELLIGKVLGSPVLGYFSFLCVLPIAAVAALAAGYSVGVVFWTYVLVLVFALFWAVCGLWLSMLVERTTVGPGLLGVIVVWPFLGIGAGFVTSPFPGFAAATPLPALYALHDADFVQADFRSAPVFGMEIPLVALTLLLYVTFGAWLALMLLRNLKNELSEIRLLSRPQAVAFVAYFNLLFYAFLDPARVGSGGRFGVTPGGVSTAAVALNASLLFLVGLATLTPPEQLRRWWRLRTAGEEGYLSAQGPSWPWLIVTAVVAYIFLGAAAFAFTRGARLDEWNLGSAAVQLLVLLVYVVRDATFLQWCMLTRIKRPILKGFLYLFLYYTAASVVAAVFYGASEPQGRLVLDLLTPFLVLFQNGGGLEATPWLYIGMGIQATVAVLLLRAISGRLSRPAAVVSTAAPRGAGEATS